MDNFKGIPTGNLTGLTGKSKTGNYFARFIPLARFIPETNETEKGVCFIFNFEQSETITKHAQCIIDEMSKKMREEGFNTSKIQRTITTNEKIGNTWFPVTYHEDGMVTVDYPKRLFCEQVKENKNGEQS
jgi:hypothetical protein